MLLPTSNFPSTKGWAEGFQTPLSFTERFSFPERFSFTNQLLSVFLAEWLSSATTKSSTTSTRGARYFTERHQPICNSWAETSTLIKSLIARGQPSPGGMTVPCPRAFTNHPLPGNIPSVIPAKQKSHNEHPFACLPTPIAQ